MWCLPPQSPFPKNGSALCAAKKVLGLASGGGQQLPIFSALGAQCTLLDYSEKQCESERMVAQREGYHIDVIRADMTKPLPFADESFDLIFHPVSNCYVEEVEPIFRECARILKKGGALLGGYDIGLAYAFDAAEEKMIYTLPFNPLKDPKVYEDSMKNGWGIQFSHGVEEQIRGQLRAGLRMTDMYEDTGSEGNLAAHNIPTFIATRFEK
jgi:Methylase involved in ubiquinone/menaquinone biosynthesis